MPKPFYTEQFYTAHRYFLNRYDQFKRQCAFSAENVEEYRTWAAELKTKLKNITGIATMVSAPLNPEGVESVEFEEYTREKVVIQTESDVFMPLYVLVPKNVEFPRPALIAPHGHDSGGKFSPAGRNDIPQIRRQIEQYNYDYGVRFVEAGFVVFCPDARGFGERREWMHQQNNEDFLHGSCRELNNIAISLGQTVTGMWAWDLMRLIDYIEQHRSDCEKEKIGCGGLSGGGMQTLWLSALDERVRCSVISGYFYGYRDSLLKLNDNCSCNYVPNLWEIADMGDIGALIAPRPLLIESGTDDPLNGERGVENVTEQLAISRKAYNLFDASDRLYHHIFRGEHRWDGEKTIPWFKKWLE